MSFTVEQIAQICHEASRGMQRILGEQVNFPWEAIGPELRNSIIDGVRKIAQGEVARPSDSHSNWLVYKFNEGWKYGPVKDFAKREHPQMVPWEELPVEQRVKNELFFAISTTLLGLS